MIKCILFVLLAMNSVSGYGQIVKDMVKPCLEWHIPIADFPFMNLAAQAEANRRMLVPLSSPASIKSGDYSNFYRNLSMSQVTEMSLNLHGTLY